MSPHLANILALLDDALSLNGRAATFDANTPLLGALPEFDSMAVAAVLAALEDSYGFAIEDDEVDGSTFETVGALVAFVEGKLG